MPLRTAVLLAALQCALVAAGQLPRDSNQFVLDTGARMMYACPLRGRATAQLTAVRLTEYSSAHLTHFGAQLVIDNELYDTVCSCRPVVPASSSKCIPSQVNGVASQRAVRSANAATHAGGSGSGGANARLH